MEIKLSLNGGLGYYFCGSIALSINNNIKNPISVDSDKLTDKEIIGLARAVKSGVVKVLEGEASLLEKAHHILSTTKNKKLAKTIDIVVQPESEPQQVSLNVVLEKEEVEVQPEVTEEVEAEVAVEEVTEETAPVVEEKKITRTTKRTTVKK